MVAERYVDSAETETLGLSKIGECNMALPSDFSAKLLATLQKRKVNPICELCGQNNWAVVDQAVSVQITDLSGGFSRHKILDAYHHVMSRPDPDFVPNFI